MLITEKKELEKFYANKRLWEGIASIERTDKGRVFSTFYSGSTLEGFGNYCLLLKSDDDGKTWTEPIAVAYAGEKARCFDSCLWIDPLKRLWFTWNVQPDNLTYAAVCDDPDAETLKWSEPKALGAAVMMNKPIVLSTGEWLFPIGIWPNHLYANLRTKMDDCRPFVYRTNDEGATFERLGGPVGNYKWFNEHMVVELSDGVLLMLIRECNYLLKSYSYDGGISWTAPVESDIKSPQSRFHISKLSDGSILLINHYKFNGRNNLTAMISDDDCKTWKGFLTFEERSGVSYPDAKETPDGFIYITYDHGRGAFLHSLADAEKATREIYMAKVTKEDILAGKIVNKDSRLRVLVNKLGKYEGDDPNPYREYDKFSESEYVSMLLKMNSNEEIVKKIFDDYGVGCMGMSSEYSVRFNSDIELLQSGKLDDDITQKVYTLKNIVSTLRKCSLNQSTDAADHMVARMFEYINANLCTEISLDDMVNDLGINKYYMCHLFSQKTNTTIVRYKNSRKITKAKLLLVKCDKPISEIATDVGFNSIAYFTKWFRQSEKITPSDFRKLNGTK